MAKPSASDRNFAKTLRRKAEREHVQTARALIAFAEVLEGWNIGPGELPDGSKHDNVETFGDVAKDDEADNQEAA